MFFSTVFSKTCNLYSAFKVRDRVSQPYKRNGTVTPS